MPLAGHINEIEDPFGAPDIYSDGVGAVYRVAGENFHQVWVVWVPGIDGGLIRRKVIGITRPISSLLTIDGQIASALRATAPLRPPIPMGRAH